jgi:predicted glycoside hydrolase/deacetylase ChbG (UPF0249 family)
MKQVRRVIINADDIGMHPAIDHGVAELAELGIITSASVMALGAPDPLALDVMRRCGVSLGLHLDFTSQMVPNGRSLPRLMLAAWTRQLDPSVLRNQIHHQLERFCHLTGQWPDFIDGHEHVHQFPGIRDVLCQVLRNLAQGIAVRDTRSLVWRGKKAAVIGALGASALARQAQRAGAATNDDFFGVYGLQDNAPLGALWRGWLASLSDEGTALGMCHPALPTDRDNAFRTAEYRFLTSSSLRALLTEFRVAPVPWPVSTGRPRYGAGL